MEDVLVVADCDDLNATTLFPLKAAQSTNGVIGPEKMDLRGRAGGDPSARGRVEVLGIHKDFQTLRNGVLLNGDDFVLSAKVSDM